MIPASPVAQDLVLVGGGHSHVAVLRRFGMEPLPGVRLTLVSNTSAAPYSGMLPGHIAGHYTRDEMQIELSPLCRFAGARFLEDEVTGLDLAGRRVLTAGHPPIAFDLLSLNVGSTPCLPADLKGPSPAWPGTGRIRPVKPLGPFLAGLDRLVAELREHPRPLVRIAVVGGGAGGVELLLSVRHRLLSQVPDGERFQFDLLTASGTVLPTHNRSVQKRFLRHLTERGVRLHAGRKVVEVREGEAVCEGGETVPFDVLLWATDAAAPAWIGASGLATDAGGFVAVSEALQSTSHPFVFAAGDVAAVLDHPRPKSGVFAVRQGPPLAANLRRALLGRPLEPFRPQRQFLSLISTGDRYAVASRGPFAWEGRWVWTLKEWIDRRWMRRYQELPAMAEAPVPRGEASAATLELLGQAAERCGGCGAKVGADVLSRVLRRLGDQGRERGDVLVGLGAPDDAAVLEVPPGRVSVQTVDFFRSFVGDPYLFGRIAANHALGDLFAMGAEPQSALAIATIPFGAEAKMEEDLYQLLAGALMVLEAHGAVLAGGHTAEGPELAFGLAATGLADPAKLLRKGGARPGDALLLTKPLGTGTLFAADMRGKARGRWIEGAVRSMLLSNAEAARLLLAHGATACTDVTGFGLLGHLVEMLDAANPANPANAAATLRLSEVPVLEGALETVRAGIVSSLQPQNLRLRRAVAEAGAASGDARFPLLFDPQTAGGLLAAVPGGRAGECLAALREGGYPEAARIGEVVARTDPDHQVALSFSPRGASAPELSIKPGAPP